MFESMSWGRLMNHNQRCLDQAVVKSFEREGRLGNGWCTCSTFWNQNTNFLLPFVPCCSLLKHSPAPSSIKIAKTY